MFFFFFQAEDGIRDHCVTGVQTCALPIFEEDQLDRTEALAVGAEHVAAGPGAVVLEVALGGELGHPLVPTGARRESNPRLLPRRRAAARARGPRGRPASARAAAARRRPAPARAARARPPGRRRAARSPAGSPG